MNRRERRAAGKQAKAEQNGLPSAVELALCETVFGHMQSGRHLEAQLCCHKALEASPEHPELLHLMALVCMNAGQLDHAVEWASRAIRKEAKPSYLQTLAAALLRLGRQEEALQVLDKAVQLAPDDADLRRSMGTVLLKAGRTGEALRSFRRVVELNPTDADAAYKAGVILKEEGRFGDALVYLDRSAAAQPDHAPIFATRGFIRASLNRYEQAIDDYERAIRLDPQHAHACANLGNALRALGRPEEALAWYDRSLALNPDIANTTNRALTLMELGRFAEAGEAYRVAMGIDPRHPALVWNLSLFQMLLGDFETSWQAREARWAIPEIAKGYPKITTPMWVGKEPVEGKTIAVFQNEGAGDAIHFARYIPMLSARGARIILVLDRELCPLLAGLSGVSHCLPKTEATVVPPFDLHIAIDSLPLAFGTRLDSIPCANAYLPAPEARLVQAWEDRLGPREKLRVGLVWSGNPTHKNDRNRSIRLRMLSGLLDVDAQFVSLQKNPRLEDVATLREIREIVDHTALLTDFAETAALISCLDLVISVDTGVAHLAAALGRPTWILLPYAPDWRWMLDRDDSPWYPTVKLFRQGETREYASVIARVRGDLSAMAGEWRSRD